MLFSNPLGCPNLQKLLNNCVGRYSIISRCTLLVANAQSAQAFLVQQIKKIKVKSTVKWPPPPHRDYPNIVYFTNCFNYN